MTLIEILMKLRYMTKNARTKALMDMDVDKALWPHIQQCFNDQGDLIINS